MISFILNTKDVRTTLPPGTTVLDFVRYHQHLTGTKIGCREGDCGACTVLVGDVSTGSLRYRTATSCLMPLGNAHGKHIVTIEGLNTDDLNLIQQAMADESATQCGFCTPGFVMSLAGYCLSHKASTTANAIAAVDGNICRCTGYKSIERAAGRVAELVRSRQDNESPAQFVADRGILPTYFVAIEERLLAMKVNLNGELKQDDSVAQRVGGGTDVYVQKHDEIKEASIRFLADNAELQGIWQDRNQCWIGPSTTVSDLVESPVMQHYFPDFKAYTKLVSSTPIRNMATLGGNFINASPIGDFTIIFLALDAVITLSDGVQTRELLLRDLYLGYKTLDKRLEEFLVRIGFTLPANTTRFNFEKVSKRTHLDIASVNSAIQLTVEGKVITSVTLSAGGVAPIPKRLTNTEAFLIGQPISEALILEAANVAQTDITPISDARGTEAYKRLLLSQLIKAHFIKLFPELKAESLLIQ
ncbi:MULTISPECIES: FAD binding domain-containing protein [unclassified Spirosoma]|uniref:FAD binding domain-containing protein n=1 Tax=unclassified Spirosoma TaxID=2621999 RepID=UPI00096A095A|nr:MULTISPECIES: FAD binding domain-containing protein [unclassified Spirosoma]MBN8826551.1 FAD binding domain-containing protein [Spirosoma sp.]OJW71595.1 MAG: (2Fe-2S)-binding protein [Spirosoma sp. 48-14]